MAAINSPLLFLFTLSHKAVIESSQFIEGLGSVQKKNRRIIEYEDVAL